MLQRVSRSILCFVAALVLYWVYAATVVPLVEPPVRRAGITNERGVAVVPTNSAYDRLFPADAWERNEPKLLETNHGALLFQDYLPQPDGTIELKPVTLIYQPSDDRGVSSSQPILIQAPQGAVLESDRPIDVARGVFGNPVGARLRGQIIIRRPPSAPGADDEVFITTRSVTIDRERIWTTNDVEFRFGPHWGRGRDLQIALASKEEGGISGPIGQGIRALELMHIEKILIAADDATLAQAVGVPGAGAPPDNAPDTPSPPIEIRCRGPFRFDFAHNIAALSEEVRLTRRFPTNVVDSLKCERLEIHFASGKRPERVAEVVPASAPSALGSTTLKIDRFLAEGTPVTLDAPSQDAYARSNYMECYYEQRRLVLEDAAGAWLRHGESEMESPRIDYTAAADDLRRLGVLEAMGPGLIRGVTSDSSRRRFTAQWNDLLQLQPHEEHHVLSLHGGARVVFEHAGEFQGEQLHLFLREAAPPGSPAEANTADARKDRFVPDRLIALRDIRLHSPQLVGHAVRELKVWFVPQPQGPGSTVRAPGRPGPAGPRNLLTPPGRNSGPRETDGPPLHFQGDVVEARVVVGDEMELTDLTVAGNVEIRRDPAGSEGRELMLRGNLLQVSEINGGRARVEVRGTPAEAGAEGLVLRGQEIYCEQASNLMWIPAQGEMVTPPRELPGNNGGAPAPPMTITWGGGMRFDGKTIAFQGGVEAHGQQVASNGDSANFLIRGTDLFVELNRHIDFVRPGNLDEQDVDLASLRFPGQVWLENRTLGPDRQWKSWEEMQVTDLRLDNATGKLEGDGPGWLSSIRLNSSSSEPSLVPGLAPPRSKLIHIQVHFQRAMAGNVKHREVEFYDHVRTVYGPVEDWQQRLDPERGPLGTGGFELASDRLHLAEIPSADNPKNSHHEIRASGNVQVRGERFTAKGHELSYDDGKDLLILRSDGRGYATVTEHGGGGSTEAATFYIRPKTKEIKTSSLRSLEFGPLSTKPKAEPQAPPGN